MTISSIQGGVTLSGLNNTEPLHQNESNAIARDWFNMDSWLKGADGAGSISIGPLQSTTDDLGELSQSILAAILK